MKILISFLIFSFAGVGCVTAHKTIGYIQYHWSGIRGQNTSIAEWVNVKDFGAKGNGIDDDSKAINKAIASLVNSSKHVLYFPKGHYLIESSIKLKGDRLSLIGESNQNTILKGKNISNLIVASGVMKDSLVISNIKFDGSGTQGAILRLNGSVMRGKLLVEKCVFYNAHLYNIWLKGIHNAAINNNTFRGVANGRGTGVQLVDGCHNIHILNNRFYYLYRGVYVVGYNYSKKQDLTPNSDIVFEHNYIDLGWYLVPAKYIGQGEDVLFTKNSLYDPNARFGKIAPKDNIRVLMPVSKGNTSKSTMNTITDMNADFRRLKIKQGDLIRIDSKQAVVDSVLSNHTLKIDSWLTVSTLGTTTPPKQDSRYSVYRLIIGKIKKNSAHKISVWRFYDFYGHVYTPKNNWTYEVMNARPNYPFFASKNNTGFQIKDNVFKRGWADQVAIYGNDATIENNLIENGQDMGITLYGSGHEVYGNTIIHQRTGVWMECKNSIFRNNTVKDCRWASDYHDAPSGAYLSVIGEGNKILNNVFERKKGFNSVQVKAINNNKGDKNSSSLKKNRFFNLEK